jgi:hypothetical protein
MTATLLKEKPRRQESQGEGKSECEQGGRDQ